MSYSTTFDSGNGLRDTILTRLGTLAFMRGHLEGIDQKLIREQVGTALGRRGRVIQVLNRDTVVTRGELIAATPSMLYVNTFPAYRDVESDKLRPETIVRFPLQNISRILVEGESRTGRDMGIGALVGFGVGAVAGFIAASSDDPDDTGYQFGVAGLMGLPGAAAGMIVGLVVGLLESAQGEEHAISTPSDILKLRPHARFPEDPPAYLVG